MTTAKERLEKDPSWVAFKEAKENDDIKGTDLLEFAKKVPIDLYGDYIEESTRELIEKRVLVKGSTIEEASPSGKFVIKIEKFEDKPEEKKGWNYTRGSIYRKGESEPFQLIHRNYSGFWFRFLQDPQGTEFLFCGRDYQGFSIINLTKNEVKHYLEPGALMGGGWCPYFMVPSPSGKYLLASGCYWAGPADFRLYQMEGHNLKKIKEQDDFTCVADISWIDEETLKLHLVLDVKSIKGQEYLSPYNTLDGFVSSVVMEERGWKTLPPLVFDSYDTNDDVVKMEVEVKLSDFFKERKAEKKSLYLKYEDKTLKENVRVDDG